MNKTYFCRVLGMCVVLALYSAGAVAEKKESLKEYLPKIELKLGGIYGPTDKEDNVFSIAQRIIPHENTVSVDKVVKAIVLKNPDAFSAGNPKKLKSGFFLKLPTLDEIQFHQEPSKIIPKKDAQITVAPPIQKTEPILTPTEKPTSGPVKVSPVSNLMTEGL